MRPLKQGLHDHELIVLRVIGEWWELDLIGTDKNGCVKRVAETLLALDLIQEKEFLPPEEATALDDLIASHGKIPVQTFARTHGEIRMMGPGRLEREEPWFDPVSAAEALWYRGFLYIGFEETSDGLMEFVYFPDELLAQFPQPKKTQPKAKAVPELNPELSKEEEVTVETLTASTPLREQTVAFLTPQDNSNQTASSNAVDDLTTLLAMAQQTGLQPDRLDKLDWLLLNPEPERRSLLINLAHEMGMLRQTKAGVRPTRTAVSWLKQSREQQLHALADAWSSSGWNELRHMPALHCEGENWENDPVLARSTLLGSVPRTANWYNLADLTAQIKQESPDFQRPDGNYDVWYIRDAATNEYINGFDNWDQVEGRLLAFLLEGPMAWLGLAITACTERRPGSQAEAAVTPNGLQFQLSDRGLEWLEGVEAASKEVRAPLVVQQDGTLIVPHNADRYQRFQAARISETDPVVRADPIVRAESGKQQTPYQYRLTPASLAQADKQGITPNRILDFLEAATGKPVPIGVKRGISRWGERGVEGKVETAVILRVREPIILDTLRNNPKTRDYIGESLGDLSAIIRPDQWQKLCNAATELGLLLDTNI